MSKGRRIDVSLILPTYNEEMHLLSSVEHIVKVLSRTNLKYEIIFVDDKSTDGTPTIISKILKKRTKWSVISHRKNLGRGRAVADGIQAARGRVVGYIDVDLEISPVYIPEIVESILSDESDVMVGNRVYPSGNDPILRQLIAFVYRIMAERLLQTGDIDVESGCKFFNRKKILSVVAKCHHPRWFWDMEMMVFARRANLRIRQMPVLFIRRPGKVSTFRLWTDSVDYLRSLWQLWHRLLSPYHAQ